MVSTTSPSLQALRWSSGVAARHRSQRHVRHPASGTIINVNAGGDLQAALNNARCGDVIQLQPALLLRGNSMFRLRTATSIIGSSATSAPDSALPAEGQRATPCYAGVASLPGRPQYPCSNPQNVMAKVQMASAGDGPFRFVDGANYYRFIGLEVTRPAGTHGKARLSLGSVRWIIW